MKTIFCPVDFSHESQLAAEWAAMLAIKRSWKLVLFNKFQIFTGNVKNREEAKDPLKDARTDTEAKLTALKNQLCAKYIGENLACEIDTDFGIDLEDVILRSAKKSNASLIVMGTKGAESFSDIIGGSNTTNIISQTSIPVLVVPDSANAKLPDTFVYASDLKEEDPQNISFVVELSHDLNAKLLFVHIKKEGENPGLAKLKEIISEVLTSLPNRKNLDISFEELKGDDFYASLQEYMNKNAGLVVLGRHPRNFFEKLLKGDFTRLMALYSFHPLLVVHKKN